MLSMVMISTNNVHAVPAQEYFFKIDSNLELDTININAHPVPKNATTAVPANVTASVSRPIASTSATASKGQPAAKPDEDDE